MSVRRIAAILLLLTVICAFGYVCWALRDSLTPEAARSGREAPSLIRAKVPRINLGVIDPRLCDDARARWIITNIGNRNVRIRSVRVSCLCFEPTVTSATLAPGGSTEVSILIQPPDREGEWVEIVRVETDDPVAPPLQLYLQARLAYSLDIIPESVHAEIPSTGEYTVEIRLVGPTGDETFHVLEMHSECAEIVAGKAVPVTCQGTPSARRVWRIPVNIVPRGLPEWTADLQIVTMGSRGRYEARIPFSVKEPNCLRMKPSLILLDETADQKISVVTRIFGTGSDLRIRRCPRWLHAELVRERDDVTMLQVRIVGPAESSAGELEIVSRDGRLLKAPFLLTK